MTNFDALLAAAWTFLNSPLGITTIAGALVAALNALYARKPAWAAYEGSIIAGIKYAEKMIPDGTENKGLARLDCAAKYVLAIYAQREESTPSAAQQAALREAIQIKHVELEGPEML